MKNQPFSSHGLLNITVDNDLVTIDIEGPCNIEFFQQMAAQLTTLKPQLNLENYTTLVILHGEALATPEAMSYFSGYIKTIQVRAVAINLQYSHCPAITEKVCQMAYSEAGIKHAFFFDSPLAIKWLRVCMSEPQ